MYYILVSFKFAKFFELGLCNEDYQQVPFTACAQNQFAFSLRRRSQIEMFPITSVQEHLGVSMYVAFKFRHAVLRRSTNLQGSVAVKFKSLPTNGRVDKGLQHKHKARQIKAKKRICYKALGNTRNNAINSCKYGDR